MKNPLHNYNKCMDFEKAGVILIGKLQTVFKKELQRVGKFLKCCIVLLQKNVSTTSDRVTEY